MRRRQEKQLAHIQHLGIKDPHQRHAVRPLLVAAPEHHDAAIILVGQELEALDVLERVDVFVLLVEEERVWFCQCVEDLKDCVQRCWAFRAVQQKRALRGLDELWFSRFQDARGARIFGFSGVY